MRFSFLIFALSFSFSAMAKAEASYRVTGKKGLIAVKGPMDTEWKPLKTKTIALGSMLMIDANSRIDLTLKSGAGSVDRKIRINQAMITRVDEDLVRRMQTKAYPLKDAWETGPESKKEVKDSPLLSFAASFFRSIVTLNKTVELPPVKDRAEVEAVQIAAKFQTIEILTPNDDALFFLDERKAQIPIIWHPPKDGLNYRLYVWDEGEGRSTPLLSLKETYYNLVLSKAGRYQLQIEDDSHQYRSKIVIITVDRSLRSVASLLEQFEKKEIGPELEFPGERTTVLSPRAIVQQRFSWKDERGLEKNERYQLYVMRQGKIHIRKLSYSLTESIGLPAGDYSWYVEKVLDRRKVKSRTRSLKIAGPKDVNFAKGSGQTVLIDFN